MFGGNFLTEHLDDKPKSRAQARQLNAHLHVVMSDHGDTSFARDLKQDSPAATVVFRPYFADDRRWPDTTMSAEQVWEAHRNYAVGGLAVQVGNEIGFSPQWMAMCVKIAQFARQEGKQVALLTPGVGNYAEGAISSGGLDAFLLELAADKRVIGSANPPNLLSVHEYAQQSTLAEQPYRIGRVKWLLDRALNKLKLPIDPQRIAITEYGRDVGGDPLEDGGMTYFGGDEQKFFDFLTPGALFYVQLGFLGTALYCQGKTWPSFDWQHATRLIDLMAAWNKEHPIMTLAPVIQIPANPGIPVPSTVVVTQLNLRTQPLILASTVIRSLATGEQVNVHPGGTITVGDYPMRYLTDSTGKPLGWAAVASDKGEVWIKANAAPAFQLDPPFRQYTIVSRFNAPRDYSQIAPEKKQLHEGCDFIPANDDCDAVIHVGASGKVTQVSVDPPGYGNFVVVDFGNGFRAVYAHFSDIYVKVGQVLADRQILGMMGDTGNASEPHVHITLSNPTIGASGYVYPAVIDPEKYLAI